MISFSTALVCVMVSYKQADNSYFRPNSLNIRRERNICWRLCFSTVWSALKKNLDDIIKMLLNTICVCCTSIMLNHSHSETKIIVY